ncbi:hypothetical protein CS0771_72820 [Catellatospora sp. IY07-71]|uniref:hypothetical protein n=1 Tax=Catellatospora sp. IY07-71 TaxID=2728827 RepID=UPI001BB39BB3|nr:hypothetical protein [Catellatospora sp. IY07-71]BCJ77738.1 hypothetical protein CS0771_72820 [Catellatospora sp. IY07-71]
MIVKVKSGAFWLCMGGLTLILVLVAYLIVWPATPNIDQDMAMMARVIAATTLGVVLMLAGAVALSNQHIVDRLREHEIAQLARDHQRGEHMRIVITALSDIVQQLSQYSKILEEATGPATVGGEVPHLHVREDLGKLSAMVELLREDQEELFEVVTRMQADNVTVLPVRRNNGNGRDPAHR